MICDREVIQQCIKIWFGSVEAFERRVQNEACSLMVVISSSIAKADGDDVVAWRRVVELVGF